MTPLRSRWWCRWWASARLNQLPASKFLVTTYTPPTGRLRENTGCFDGFVFLYSFNVFYKLILFSKVFTELQVDLYRFKGFKLFSEIWPVKVGPHNRFLMGKGNKTALKEYFVQNLSLPTFFKQSSSNFHSLIFIQ